MTNYTLRKAQNEDINILYDIKKNSIKPYVSNIWGWDEVFQKNEFDNTFSVENINVIVSGKKVIGFVEVFEDDTSINISEIHIIPSFQRKGIGSKIVREITMTAKIKQKEVCLGCFKDNNNALVFYKNLGFSIVNETDTHFIFKL